MNKRYLLILSLLILFSCSSKGPYDEDADATQLISSTLAKAEIEKLPVIIIFGANWCPECRWLNDEIYRGKNANLIAKEFKVVKVNVGNFDTNLEIAKKYGNPISGGIPGVAILSFHGKLIYTTRPGELTIAKSHGDDGLYSFFKKAAKT